MKNLLKNIVIVGNGMVGYKLCEKLVEQKLNTLYNIIVFGEESRPAYDRVHLSEYFNGKTADDLSLSTKELYQENGIKLYLGDPVQEIDRENKLVHSLHGIRRRYDYLVLATGSSAFVPDIPGVEKDGVFVYRTIEDLELIKSYAAKSRSAAVMGGGLLGLEAAKALLDLGLPETHIIEFAPRLMPRQVDSMASLLLQSKLKQLGLQMHLNRSTTQIHGAEKIETLQFGDNTSLRLDMLVISAGIRPRDELAKLCRLEVGTRGGIVVNEQLQTNDPDIFAI